MCIKGESLKQMQNNETSLFCKITMNLQYVNIVKIRNDYVRIFVNSIWIKCVEDYGMYLKNKINCKINE